MTVFQVNVRMDNAPIPWAFVEEQTKKELIFMFILCKPDFYWSLLMHNAKRNEHKKLRMHSVKFNMRLNAIETIVCSFQF